MAGDSTRLEVRVGQNARCFIGTQATTKIYRNPRSLPCGHTTSAVVEDNAILVFAPAPVQPFEGSSYEQRQSFRLAPSAGLALVDWFTSGRSARGERWCFTRFSSRNEVCFSKTDPAQVLADRSGQLLGDPVFLDACLLDETAGPLTDPHRTGRFNCFATLLLVGAPLERAAQRLLEQIGQLEPGHRHALLASASPIRHGAVLRLAGERVADVECFLRGHLAALSECLGEDPWARRW